MTGALHRRPPKADFAYGLGFDDFIKDWGKHWDAMLVARGNNNPLLLLAWLTKWWQHFGRTSEALVICHGDGSELVNALFTHIVRQRYLGLEVKLLQCWVNNHSLRAGLISDAAPAPGADSLASAVLDVLTERRRSWDLARLRALPQSSGFAPLLVAKALERGWQARIERRWPHSCIRISQPWPQFYRGLSRQAREKGERLGRRLAEQGACTWRKYQRSEVKLGLEAYLEIEAQSWKAKAGEVIRRDSVLSDFYRQVLCHLAEDGRSEVDVLSVSGHPVCGLVSLRYGHRRFVLKTSYVEAFQRYSPGWLVYRKVIEESFSEGDKEIDLFGYTRFTRSWSQQTQEFDDVLIVSPTPRARLFGLAKSVKDRLETLR